MLRFTWTEVVMIIVFLVVLSNGTYYKYIKVDTDAKKIEEKTQKD